MDKKKHQDGIQNSALEQKQAEELVDQEKWEDDINQFLKLEETEETRGNRLKNNDTWIKAAEDWKNGSK